MVDEYLGTCGCGRVHVALDGEPHIVFNCHCTTCRKMSGGAFSSYAVFDKNALRVTEGEAEIQTTRAGTHGLKYFCRGCGAPLYGLHELAADICLVPLGVIDTGGALVPIANVFCQNKLPWTFELGKMINHELSLPA
jgi:hypothetical protein